jgi:hypothetical protein
MRTKEGAKDETLFFEDEIARTRKELHTKNHYAEREKARAQVNDQNILFRVSPKASHDEKKKNHNP